ncbi:MAG: TdeIII family type II restriction endonuclease [Candidatus Nanoarchaeia archaeon]|nr:TdeIII family type II restriction endonuclease [Candidatus Nanoarchaeia archaeon]MDD5740396.1 TdeIII family type II restriction endonuclease [Candidatus Nanoarchaeia archaeon]
MISANKKERIAYEVIKTLKSRFESFPEDSKNNRNAPFHEAFLNAFSNKLEGNIKDAPYLISLSSWLHGLNTTLGQSFFENIAHILSGGIKKEFTKKKRSSLCITTIQQSEIASIITSLKSQSRKPNLVGENKLIFQLDKSTIVEAMDFTADNYIETDTIIEAIELKSVKPNSGEMRGEKQKILIAKAALKKKYPSKDIKFYIGFPFDPTSSTLAGTDKNRFMSSIIEFNKFFSSDEVLIGDELWDQLSGDEKTMQQILDIINKIATKDFIDNFNFLKNPENQKSNPKKYDKLIKEWNLSSKLLT